MFAIIYTIVFKISLEFSAVSSKAIVVHCSQNDWNGNRWLLYYSNVLHLNSNFKQILLDIAIVP